MLYFTLPLMIYWQQILAVAQRILIELWRRKRSLLFWFLFPVAVLWLNASIFADRAGLSFAAALELATPSTLIGAALFFSCLGGTVATLVTEREQQTLKRLFLSPLSGAAYFLGICLAQSAIAIGQTLILFTLAILLGAKFNGSILLGIVVIILGIISYVGMGFVLGTQLAQRTEDINTLIAAFGVPLLILGGAFFPTSIFPPNLLNLAQFNPIYHLNEALLGVAAGNDWGSFGKHLIILALVAMLSLMGGWFFYRRMLARERQL